jgi:hypothetical protein
LLRRMVAQFGGTISYDWQHAGLAAKITFPFDAIRGGRSVGLPDFADSMFGVARCSALLATSYPTPWCAHAMAERVCFES